MIENLGLYYLLKDLATFIQKDGWLYGIAYARLHPLASHDLVWIAIIIASWIVIWKTRNGILTIVFGGMILGLDESYWNLLFFTTKNFHANCMNCSDFYHPAYVPLIALIVAVSCCFGLLYVTKTIRKYLICLAPFFIFLAYWYAIGFPLTINFTLPYEATTSYYDLLTNYLEILHFVIYVPLFTWFYLKYFVKTSKNIKHTPNTNTQQLITRFTEYFFPICHSNT
jgi:hypothetical protein